MARETQVIYRNADLLSFGGQFGPCDWRAGPINQAIAGGANSRVIDCGQITRGRQTALSHRAFARTLGLLKISAQSVIWLGEGQLNR